MMKDFAQRFIKLHGDSDSGLISALIEKGITSEKRIRNYMIVTDFFHYLVKKKKWSLSTIYGELAEQYGLTDRQILNIVHKWRGKFKVFNT